MCKTKSILLSSIVLLSSLGLGNMARGQGQGMWRDGLREPQARPGIERLLALLDSDRVRAYLRLEGPQIERLRQLALATEKASVKTQAEIEVRGIDLREALRADKPDHDEILRKVQEISDLRGQMMKQHVEAILGAKAVLSPEQQRRLFFLMETRGEGGPRGEQRGGVRVEPLPKSDAPPQPIPIHPGEPPVQ